MNIQCNIDKATLKNQLDRKIQNLQTPIATIEICLFLLSQEYENENIGRIKMALQQIRVISKSFLDITG